MIRDEKEFPGPAPEPNGTPDGERTRYDLEALVALAERDRACDETVKVRVTQDDIRNLRARRRTKEAE